MGSRADIVAAVAPPAPPCFETRMQWVAYLGSAAENQKENKPYDVSDRLVLVRDDEGSYQVNRRVLFCRDCTSEHKAAMQAVGRCRPQYLRDVIPVACSD